MQYVLDASVTLSWFYQDEVTPESAALLDTIDSDDPIAPSIWIYEVVNSFVLSERHHRITAAQAEASLEQLRALPVEVVAYPEIGAIRRLAHRYELTSYDAAYLDLAEARGLPLATRDPRLRAAAEAAGVRVLAA